MENFKITNKNGDFYINAGGGIFLNNKPLIDNQGVLGSHPIGTFYFTLEKVSPAQLFGGQWDPIIIGITLPLGDNAPITGNIINDGHMYFINNHNNVLPVRIHGGINGSVFVDSANNSIAEGYAIYHKGLQFVNGQADLTNNNTNPKLYVWKRTA